jgi:hypothetical protein
MVLKHTLTNLDRLQRCDKVNGPLFQCSRGGLIGPSSFQPPLHREEIWPFILPCPRIQSLGCVHSAYGFNRIFKESSK